MKTECWKLTEIYVVSRFRLNRNSGVWRTDLQLQTGLHTLVWNGVNHSVGLQLVLLAKHFATLCTTKRFHPRVGHYVTNQSVF